MNYLKKLLKPLLISFIAILISIFIFTLMEYIGIISNNIFSIIITIIIILSFLIGGIIFGKRSNKKGWLEGIKLGLIECTIIILINLFASSTSIKNIIIYLIVFFSSILGSIIGVNKNNIKT